ncbi:hypothetical protein E1B28_002601 [Marasmius oreades]|uniref:Uncharacterized protein n=1 Tax=Marasmius oreades TaxID=181124 RepID=A0A9P7RP12_9AGAR|nr:uncharacterized protein E1B28_002601 [Marasmius oreades]KAG7086661.1 hypothetical protein E1B28_002601 [Marasmius oreades]
MFRDTTSQVQFSPSSSPPPSPSSSPIPPDFYLLFSSCIDVNPPVSSSSNWRFQVLKIDLGTSSARQPPHISTYMHAKPPFRPTITLKTSVTCIPSRHNSSKVFAGIVR